MRVALRCVLREACRLGQIAAEEYQRAADVRAITGETLPAGRELGSGGIAALMAGCESDPSAAGARDAAIIGLMYETGMRREEVIAIDLADYEQDMGRLVIREKHESVTTTARYDRRPEQAKQKAAKLLHIPYHRRRGV